MVELLTRLQLPLNKLDAAFVPGEWILFQVVSLDESNNIDVVEVLDHSVERKVISKKLRAVHKRNPTAHLCVYLVGHRPVSGAEFRSRLAELAREDYVNARW